MIHAVGMLHSFCVIIEPPEKQTHPRLRNRGPERKETQPEKQTHSRLRNIDLHCFSLRFSPSTRVLTSIPQKHVCQRDRIIKSPVSRLQLWSNCLGSGPKHITSLWEAVDSLFNLTSSLFLSKIKLMTMAFTYQGEVTVERPAM